MSDVLNRQLRTITRRMDLGNWLRRSAFWLTISGSLGLLTVLGFKLAGRECSPVVAATASLGLGLTIATAVSIARRTSPMDAAISLDRALDLKERLSTWTTLSADERTSDIGQSLASDLHRRAEEWTLDDKLPVVWPRRAWAPTIPLLLLFAVGWWMAPLNLAGGSVAKATVAEQEQIQQQAKLLERKMADRENSNEPQVDPLLKEVHDAVRETAREVSKNPDRGTKDAVLKLSDLAKKIEDQRRQLDSVDAMKKALEKLSSNAAGPAEKLNQALKNGDFTEAAKQLEEMQKKLSEDKMSAAEKKELAKQLATLQKKLDPLANLKDRKEKIEKSNLPPDVKKSELERLRKEADKLKQLQQLSEQLGKCSQCMGQGEKGDGELQQALAEAKRIAEQMASDDRRAEMMEQTLQDLEQCRSGMCQGGGESDQQSDRVGDGLGRGRGKGDRPEKETKTRSRETQANVEQTKGKNVIVGETTGRTTKGVSQFDLSAQAPAAARAADEAITRQKVPNDYKDHARDYFEKLGRE